MWRVEDMQFKLHIQLPLSAATSLLLSHHSPCNTPLGCAGGMAAAG